MRPEVGIAWKDVLEFFRSKHTVFWSLAFPILMMLFFGTVFGGGREYLVPVAVVDLDGSSLSSVYVEAMNSTGAVVLKPFRDLEEAREAVREGRGGLAGLLVIRGGFSSNLSEGRPALVEFYVREGGAQTRQLLTNFVIGFTEGFNEKFRRRVLEVVAQYIPEQVGEGKYAFSREMIIAWIEFVAKPVRVRAALLTRPQVTAETAAYWENPGHWVSAMIAYSLLFSGMVTSTYSLVAERERGTLKRIRLSGAPVWSVLMGKVASSLAILTLSQLVLVAAALAFVRAELCWSPLLVPLVLAGDLASISIGLLIAELSPRQRAAGEAVVVVAVMLQFVSGFYFPIAFLPEPLRSIAEVLPFAKAVEAMDLVLLGGATLSEVAGQVTYLTITAVAFTLASIALFPRWAEME